MGNINKINVNEQESHIQIPITDTVNKETVTIPSNNAVYQKTLDLKITDLNKAFLFRDIHKFPYINPAWQKQTKLVNTWNFGNIFNIINSYHINADNFKQAFTLPIVAKGNTDVSVKFFRTDENKKERYKIILCQINKDGKNVYINDINFYTEDFTVTLSNSCYAFSLMFQRIDSTDLTLTDLTNNSVEFEYTGPVFLEGQLGIDDGVITTPMKIINWEDIGVYERIKIPGQSYQSGWIPYFTNIASILRKDGTSKFIKYFNPFFKNENSDTRYILPNTLCLGRYYEINEETGAFDKGFKDILNTDFLTYKNNTICDYYIAQYIKGLQINIEGCDRRIDFQKDYYFGIYKINHTIVDDEDVYTLSLCIKAKDNSHIINSVFIGCELIDISVKKSEFGVLKSVTVCKIAEELNNCFSPKYYGFINLVVNYVLDFSYWDDNGGDEQIQTLNVNTINPSYIKLNPLCVNNDAFISNYIPNLINENNPDINISKHIIQTLYYDDLDIKLGYINTTGSVSYNSELWYHTKKIQIKQRYVIKLNNWFAPQNPSALFASYYDINGKFKETIRYNNIHNKFNPLNNLKGIKMKYNGYIVFSFLTTTFTNDEDVAKENNYLIASDFINDVSLEILEYSNSFYFNERTDVIDESQNSILKCYRNSIIYSNVNTFNQEANLLFKDGAKRRFCKDTVPLIIICGQSNANGACPIADSKTPEWFKNSDYKVPNYYMWNKITENFELYGATSNNGAWSNLTDNTAYNSMYSFDPFFAKKFIEKYPNKLYAIRHTMGGIGIGTMPTTGNRATTWQPKISTIPNNCNSMCLG